MVVKKTPRPRKPGPRAGEESERIPVPDHSPASKTRIHRIRELSILRSPVPRQILTGAGICVAYILAGKLSLRLASVHPSATPVWPPTGIAVATLIAFGVRFWPCIFLGAFVVNLTTAGSVLTTFGISTGNTLEAVLAAFLVTRFANGKRAMESSRDILRFALYGGVLSSAVAATVGVTTLTLGGYAQPSQYGLIWRTWWLGDAAGALIFTPFLLLLVANLSGKWTKRLLVEAGVAFGSLIITAGIVFGVFFHARISGDPWTFLCTPFLVWIAFRFGQREASAATCLLSAIAVVGTVQGRGPFVRETANESLLLLQTFLSCMALMTLIFGAEVSERRRQEEHARRLAVSDPLTGLANYRLLADRMDAEIKRYGRDERPFSVILLDLDGLKKINDVHGHVVGSLAICRVAEVLHLCCRAVDTPARYGGDEFALVLPGTPADQARRVAQRISQRISEDAENPRLSVSIGVAEYPRDGSTIELMLSAADKSLYDEKRRTRASVPATG